MCESLLKQKTVEAISIQCQSGTLHIPGYPFFDIHCIIDSHTLSRQTAEEKREEHE